MQKLIDNGIDTLYVELGTMKFSDEGWLSVFNLFIFFDHFRIMDNNPTQCYLGLDSNLHKSIYCDCATGFEIQI